MVNKVLLIGRLGSHPEMRVYESGRKVTWFNLATNERYKDNNNKIQEKTEWHRITCYGALADFVYENITKGKLIFIEGKLHYYKDKKDVTRTEIVAQKIRVLERKSSTQQIEETPSVEPSEIEKEDIPF